MGLAGVPAVLWRKLLDGPVPDAGLNDAEQALIREFAAVGIASDDPLHPARILELRVPWMSSPVHEMVYALVASVARDHGVDAISIKGPMLHRQGLRAREHSGDVDVWADPAHLEVLCGALEAWGWNGRTTNGPVSPSTIRWPLNLARGAVRWTCIGTFPDARMTTQPFSPR